MQGFRGDTSLDLWLFEKRNLNKTQAAVIFDFYSYLTSSLPAAIEAAEDELMPMIKCVRSRVEGGWRPGTTGVVVWRWRLAPVPPG